MQRGLITPPIIVDESGDIDVFETIEGAEMYLEAVDVKNQRFVAYDSEGRLLRLLPTMPKVTIEAAEGAPTHSEDARQVLIKFLTDVGTPKAGLEEESLQELVATSLNFKIR